MSTRVEVLSEVTTVDPSPGDGWSLALQWCRHISDEGDSPSYGYRLIWRDENGNLRSATGQARLHSLALIRDLLQKAEAKGWRDHEAIAVCDSGQHATDASVTTAGEVYPQGALALVGAWDEIDDQEVDAMVKDIYAARRLDTGRPVELED